MPPGFPTHQCCRIDAQLLGHLPLRKTWHSASGDKALREGIGRRQMIIS
jgi:hypothetical protein